MLLPAAVLLLLCFRKRNGQKAGYRQHATPPTKPPNPRIKRQGWRRVKEKRKFPCVQTTAMALAPTEKKKKLLLHAARVATGPAICIDVYDRIDEHIPTDTHSYFYCYAQAKSTLESHATLDHGRNTARRKNKLHSKNPQALTATVVPATTNADPKSLLQHHPRILHNKKQKYQQSVLEPCTPHVVATVPLVQRRLLDKPNGILTSQRLC